MPPTPTIALPPHGARCAHHPEREAATVCARCGGFVCASCRVGDDLCSPCKRRLLKDGVPWTPEEKHRAAARTLRGRSELVLRVEMGIAAAGVLVTMGASNGFLPRFLTLMGQGLWGLACVVGLGVAGTAFCGLRRSEAGRPGPNVAGVFPAGHAALVGGLALIPVVLSASLLLGR